MSSKNTSPLRGEVLASSPARGSDTVWSARNSLQLVLNFLPPINHADGGYVLTATWQSPTRRSRKLKDGERVARKRAFLDADKDLSKHQLAMDQLGMTEHANRVATLKKLFQDLGYKRVPV